MINLEISKVDDTFILSHGSTVINKYKKESALIQGVWCWMRDNNVHRVRVQWHDGTITMITEERI